MKLSSDKCLITGVQVGEVQVNLIVPGRPLLSCKVALVREDGSFIGQVSKDREFSEKTLKALEELTAALEEDVLRETFETTTEAPEKGTEPPQF